MSDSLFTPDEVQEIKVDYQDGSWHVIDPEAENDVVCIFENEGLSSSHQKQKVTVRIIKFQQAVAGGNHYLTVQLLDEDEERNNQTGSKSSRGDSDRTYPERHLTQFAGSVEYVTLEAELLWIDYIEKEKRHMPDIKGTLGEQGSTKNSHLSSPTIHLTHSLKRANAFDLRVLKIIYMNSKTKFRP